MSRTGCLLLLLCAATAQVACGPPPSPPRVGSPLPRFELPALDGTSFSSEQLAGRPAVVSFWATWCQPCLKDIPEFNALASEHLMEVVAVALDSAGSTTVEPFLEDHDFKARVLLGDEEIFRRFGGATVPLTLVVDADGIVRAIFRGPVTREEILRSLEPGGA